MMNQTKKVLTQALNNFGFLQSEQDLEVLAKDQDTRLAQVLVRCGGGRFACSTQDARHFITLVVSGRDADQTEYIRDVALTAGACDYWRGILGMKAA
jgi:hypothetical protein